MTPPAATAPPSSRGQRLGAAPRRWLLPDGAAHRDGGGREAPGRGLTYLAQFGAQGTNGAVVELPRPRGARHMIAALDLATGQMTYPDP